jgi:hypothetical protein
VDGAVKRSGKQMNAWTARLEMVFCGYNRVFVIAVINSQGTVEYQTRLTFDRLVAASKHLAIVEAALAKGASPVGSEKWQCTRDERPALRAKDAAEWAVIRAANAAASAAAASNGNTGVANANAAE